MSLHKLKTAIRLHRNGNLDGAHELYSELVENNPEDARVVCLLGQLQLQMGKTTAALEHLRQAANLVPEDTRIAMTLARGLASTGHADEALDRVHLLLADDDANAEAWATLAAVHRHRHDHVNELVALERATELAPDDVPILIAKANAEAANNYLERAINTLRHAASQAPDNPRIVNNLGALYLRRNNLDAAVKALTLATKLAPDYAMAVSNLATALHRMGQLETARTTSERALQLAPDSIDARTELASILMAQGDLAGAEAAYKAALELAPAHQPVLAGFAELRQKQGRSQEGLRLIADVIESDQASADIRLVGASMAHRLGRRETALEMLSPLLDGNGDPLDSLDRRTRRRLGFLMGDVHDASGDYGVALRHYTLANSVLRPDYDAGRLYRYVDSIIESFDADSVKTRTNVVAREPKRLFIVGLPRSGASLLETMLARHPAVHACGELPVLARLVNENELFPTGFKTIGDPLLTRLGDRYCAASAAPPDTQWMTDKMPLNFFYLGAIPMILPDALIVHCQRYPADTLLSCYFQNFLDPALAFSFDFENLSHYWHNYSRLMRHWHKIMDDRIVDLHYEELVADPEVSMRQLLDRLSLDWNEEVLNPHESGKYVSTATHPQVREPIHSRSVGRFARYRPFLGEYAELLANLP